MLPRGLSYEWPQIFLSFLHSVSPGEAPFSDLGYQPIHLTGTSRKNPCVWPWWPSFGLSGHFGERARWSTWLSQAGIACVQRHT